MKKIPTASTIKIIGQWILLALLAIGWRPILVQASQTAPTIITLTVASDIGQVYGTRKGIPIMFYATVEKPSGGLPFDFYLVVLAPDGRMFSWVPTSSGGAALVEGLVPAVRNVAASFNTSTLFGGRDPQYTFSGTEPLGLYSVVGLAVFTGQNPSNELTWFGATMWPLVVRP